MFGMEFDRWPWAANFPMLDVYQIKFSSETQFPFELFNDLIVDFAVSRLNEFHSTITTMIVCNSQYEYKINKVYIKQIMIGDTV